MHLAPAMQGEHSEDLTGDVRYRRKGFGPRTLLLRGSVANGGLTDGVLLDIGAGSVRRPSNRWTEAPRELSSLRGACIPGDNETTRYGRAADIDLVRGDVASVAVGTIECPIISSR
jgi:hypothetical protein